jgi:membrane-associated phospholipid phosphatase
MKETLYRPHPLPTPDRKTLLWIGLGILFSYLWIDRSLALYLHEHPFATHFFKAVTKLGQSEYYLLPALAVYLSCRKENPLKARYALLLFGSVALSGLGADLIKVILARYRPELLFTQGLYGFDWFHLGHAYLSFPSGHSATAFSAMSVLALIWPRYTKLFFLFAALIALSRVILAAHYLSDVLAGSLLGYLTTLWLYRKIFENKGVR